MSRTVQLIANLAYSPPCHLLSQSRMNKIDQAENLVGYAVESFEAGVDFCPLPIKPMTSKISLDAATPALPP